MPTPTLNPEACHPAKPSPMRNLSEFAVADTPGTSGPEYAGSGDYLQSRFAPSSPQYPPHPQQHHQHPESQSQSQGDGQGQNQDQAPQEKESGGGGMPSA